MRYVQDERTRKARVNVLNQQILFLCAMRFETNVCVYAQSTNECAESTNFILTCYVRDECTYAQSMKNDGCYQWIIKLERCFTHQHHATWHT